MQTCKQGPSAQRRERHSTADSKGRESEQEHPHTCMCTHTHIETQSLRCTSKPTQRHKPTAAQKTMVDQKRSCEHLGCYYIWEI